MFGHVDAGVLHVITLNLTAIRTDVTHLNKFQMKCWLNSVEYGGLLWGNTVKAYVLIMEKNSLHTNFGKVCVMWSSYLSDNRLNFSKIYANNSDAELIPFSRNACELAIAKSRFKCEMNSKGAMNCCNGNGLCFNFDEHSIMCPSAEVIKAARVLAKRMTAMVREWLRLMANENIACEQ